MKINSTNFPEIIKNVSDGETLPFAYEELLKYLKLIFGNELSFDKKKNFYITLNPNNQLLGSEGYSIEICDNKIEIQGATPLATLFGVYSFLKDHLGCCFAAPGGNGEFIPQIDEILLEHRMTIKQPSIPYRGMQLIHRFEWQTMIDAFDWMAKNGFNYVMYMPIEDDVRNDLKTTDPETGEIRDNGAGRYNSCEFRKFLLPEITKRGLNLDVNHHNLLAAWLPPIKYFSEHPEWYPLVNGKREARSPQLAICTSNQGAVNQVIENIKTFLAENSETTIVGVIPEDGFGDGCQCDNCKKLDIPGDKVPKEFNHRSPNGENQILSNRYSILVNQIAEALEKDFPNVKIAALFYVDIQWPPRNIKFHKNVYPTVAVYWRCGAHTLNTSHKCEINEFFWDILKQWSKAKPNDFILYEYYMGMNAQSALPYPMAPLIIEEWRELIKLGVQGATVQSNPQNYSVYGLNYLAFTEAAWNNDASYKDVLDYWLKGVFGSVANEIRPIFEALDAAMLKIANGATHDTLTYGKPAIGHILPDGSNIAYFIDELTIEFIEKCINNARGKISTKREEEQIGNFAKTAKYWEYATDYFRILHRTRFKNFRGFTELELKDFFEKFERMEKYRLSIENMGWAKISRPIKFPTNIKML